MRNSVKKPSKKLTHQIDIKLQKITPIENKNEFFDKSFKEAFIVLIVQPI